MYCGPSSRCSKTGDSPLGRGWLAVVLAGEPLLAATGDAEHSTLESCHTEEVDVLLGDLRDSIFFSTHTGEEEVFFDFFGFLAVLGGDSEQSRLLFLLGRGNLLLL